MKRFSFLKSIAALVLAPAVITSSEVDTKSGKIAEPSYFQLKKQASVFFKVDNKEISCVSCPMKYIDQKRHQIFSIMLHRGVIECLSKGHNIRDIELQFDGITDSFISEFTAHIAKNPGRFGWACPKLVSIRGKYHCEKRYTTA